jgi:hypothetical protein
VDLYCIKTVKADTMEQALATNIAVKTCTALAVLSLLLLQVHVAESHDGHKLAVKVQHPGLRESSTADIATIEALVKAVRTIFPVGIWPATNPQADVAVPFISFNIVTAYIFMVLTATGLLFVRRHGCLVAGACPELVLEQAEPIKS